MEKNLLVINTTVKNKIFVALTPLEFLEKNFSGKIFRDVNYKKFHRFSSSRIIVEGDKSKFLTGLTRGDKFYYQASERSKNRSFYFRASADNIGFKTLYKKNISTANSDKILLLIDKVLKKEKVGLKKIGGIVVVAGPGSFTAVRQGVVVGNALGFFLKIPVVGVGGNEFTNDDGLLKIGYEKIRKAKVGEMVLPLYGGEPNITMPKPKL